MRFLRLTLEGYGRFGERTVFEFDRGLTCIVGANESGKSTLLSALLDALYMQPTSAAQAPRERIHWGHPRGWTLELELELRGIGVRIRKFHPVDDPRRRGEFTLECAGETFAGDEARARWEQLWCVPQPVYRATACVAQRAVARIEKGDLQSLHQQLRESAVNTDLNRILQTLSTERRRLRITIEAAQSRLNEIDQRLYTARQSEQQRRALYEQLHQAQQEAEVLSKQLAQDESVLTYWRTLKEQRTALERLREEVQTNQRHLEQLEQIERALQDVESALQRNFSLWDTLPSDHKAQVDAAWMRYRDALRQWESLEREAQAQREAQQEAQRLAAAQAKARFGYLVLALALSTASIPLWSVSPVLGALALALGIVALAVAWLWRKRTTVPPDTPSPTLEITADELRSHRGRLLELLAQAGYALDIPAPNGASYVHARETLYHFQHALERYHERWNAFQERLAQQQRLQHQRDALYQLVPDPAALRERQRELAVHILGLEEQIERNPLAQSNLSERELIALEAQTHANRQRLDDLRATQLRCEGALQNLPTYEPADALELERTRAQQHIEQLQHRMRLLETTEQLLRETNTRYLNDLSPRLKPHIEQYLPSLTLGRYTQVALDDDLSLQVYHPERDALLAVQESTMAWSAGVLDQLFFACRLGLADALSDDLHLPLLLDDPFVHADEARYRAALELLQRIAHTTQVIFCTCRPLPAAVQGRVIQLPQV